MGVIINPHRYLSQSKGIPGVGNYVYIQLWGGITHPCSSVNGDSAALSLNLGHGRVITSYRNCTIINPLRYLGQSNMGPMSVMGIMTSNRYGQ